MLTTEEREETSEEPGPGPGWKTPYDKWNFSWENHGKTWDMPMINGGLCGQFILRWAMGLAIYG